MSSRVLSDDNARKRAADDLSTTLVVEAAAGTGKTTLLIRRVLSILQQMQVSIAQIAAITFTEKAAGELKVKLRNALETVVANRDEQIVLDEETAPRFRQALLELDAMPVGTIHGFCRDLIAQRPVEAGVDPQFVVAEEQTAQLLRDQVWDQWIASELSYDNEVVRPLLEAGIPLSASRNGCSLRTLFDFLIDHRQHLTGIHINGPDEAELQEHTVRFRDDLRRELQILNACRDHSDLCARELRKLEPWLAEQTTAAPDELADWLERAPAMKGQGGNKKSWATADALETAKTLRKEFLPRVNRLRCALFSHWSALLIPRLQSAVALYQNLKRERGLLDFDDLLIVARDLLKHHPQVREQFKSQFAYLLVDEFQDTDPLQAEIVFFLCERAGRSAGKWDEVELDPGKLFIVGDPKQSIYRFRRADLDLYGKTKELIRRRGALGEGDCITINVNFRSVPEILGEVNAIFEPWMTGPTKTRYEPEYVPLIPFRESSNGFPRAVFITPPAAKNGEWNADESAGAEAAAIAAYILSITASAGEATPARFSFRDIALLYSATTHLSALETALRSHGIPYHVARGRAFTSRSEIQTLLTVLAAIDNPYDEVSVVGAVRSPFFSCSDEDLLRHRRRFGNFVYLNECPDSPLYESFAILRRLHEQRNRQPASQVITSLLEQTCGLSIFALKPQGESRVANLLKVLELARALDVNAESSFHDLVHSLGQMEKVAQEDDSPATEPGDNVVQLTTIHKAKGLQFKVVILYQIGHDPQRSSGPILNREDHRLEWRAADWETSGYAAALEEERDRDDHETRRLLYVALTRAEELLVVPAYWKCKRSRGNSLFHQVFQSRFADSGNGRPLTAGTAFTVFATDDLDLKSEPREAITLHLEPLPEEDAVVAARQNRERWESERQRAAALLDHHHRFLVPSDHEWPEPVARPEFEEEPRRDGRPLGELVHRILQQAKLDTGEDLESLAATYGEALNLNPAVIAEGVMLARRALASPLLARALRSDQIYRELRFTAMVEGRLCEGAMDLVFIEHGRPVIVDYKTDRISEKDVPARAAIYRSQTTAYAHALQAILKGSPPSVLLFFLRPNVIVEMPIATTNLPETSGSGNVHPTEP